jgi:hypothetical protein
MLRTMLEQYTTKSASVERRPRSSLLSRRTDHCRNQIDTGEQRVDKTLVTFALSSCLSFISYTHLLDGVHTLVRTMPLQGAYLSCGYTESQSAPTAVVSIQTQSSINLKLTSNGTQHVSLLGLSSYHWHDGRRFCRSASA